jgi:2,5-diketo-D-gluconate reductase A
MSEAPKQQFILEDGFVIPAIGFGTFDPKGTENTKNAVLTALREGYRYIDTAVAYGNETFVGEAIRESGIPREELFVSTKL